MWLRVIREPGNFGERRRKWRFVVPWLLYYEVVLQYGKNLKSLLYSVGELLVTSDYESLKGCGLSIEDKLMNTIFFLVCTNTLLSIKDKR